ncbi:hypothetical protein KYC5002_51420 [Archangium violaceum]|nr:hypothetical protein KYC5002_51420 [Archangium gephyra]
MAQSLTPGETGALLERFGYCYDSLIHRNESPCYFVGRELSWDFQPYAA